jgi:flagellar basal-body rod protein FlgB
MEQKLSIFQALGRRMDWLGQRQNVLSQNIANADTPDYAPQDLKRGPFERLLTRQLAPVAPAATHPKHLAGSAPSERPVQSQDQGETYETAPSGNAVVLEEQLVKVAETQMDYQTMTNLYRKHMQMFRIALGRGGS